MVAPNLTIADAVGESRPVRRRPFGVFLACIVTAAVLLTALLGAASAPGSVRGASDEVRILLGEPRTLDPAQAGDHGSAQVIAQLYERLTDVDPALNVQPALAASWEILDGGRRIQFRLRPGLTFSDGSPLDASDVVRSWLRLIDPARPSPLASLMLDVRGAREYMEGRDQDPATVGLRAAGEIVEVELVRPAADFVSVIAGPSFGVVPRQVVDAPTPDSARGFVGSGGYLLSDVGGTGLTLQANERYWAGRPAIRTVYLVSDLGGRTIVDAYAAGDLDYASIPSYDAAWIRYDQSLGPDLRSESSPSVEYLGFNTQQPPFDDVRVRRAFAQAVNWRRIVQLAVGDAAVPATGMVPPGIPGRSERDFLPAHDPDAARALLADAGYPGGAGFPEVIFTTAGTSVAAAVLEEVRRELGITIRFETMDWADYTTRLEEDPPAMWSLGWVADYPGANDFLGVLLGSGEQNNYGRWSSKEFDAAILAALSATDPVDGAAAFERAQEIVQRDAPVVPLTYDAGWSLARDGLLGAHLGGLGDIRLAGLAWADR
jgi:oligopeptide transport system substrate-binding protein